MRYQHTVLRLVCGDETTAIAATGEVHASHMPYPMTVTGVRASLTTGPTTGTMLVDIEEEGVSILAAPIQLTAGETSSTVASNLPFIVDDVLGDAARVAVVVVDEASGDAAGLKVDIIGHRWILPFVGPYGLSGPSGEGVGLPVVPLTPPPVTVTINQGSGQADPSSATPVVFDVVFSQPVTGFATGDVTLSGTAGATAAVVSGSGSTYTVSVSGMTASGTVIASIAAGVCTSIATGAPNNASTSTDNTVQYNAPAITNVVAHWDTSEGSTTTTFLEDLIGACDLTGTNLVTDTQNGLTILKATGVASRLKSGNTSPIAGGSQPYGVTVVAKSATIDHIYFNLGPSSGSRPLAGHNSGTPLIFMDAGAVGSDGAPDLHWHVLYFEFNGASSKIYIDGVLEATVNAGTTATVGSIVTFMNNQDSAQNGGVADTMFAEAKLSTGVQLAADVLGEARTLYAKWVGTNAIATGGTITIDTPTLVEHTFLSGGELRLPPGGSLPYDWLVVAGGGAGARGGGGAGGVRSGSATLTGSLTVTVGTGGTGASMTGATNPVAGASGGNSSLGATTSTGGGGGGGGGATGDGVNGGSGGGGGATSGVNKLAGTGVAGQGNAGGRADTFTAANFPSGGGGGAGAAGGNATGASQSGVGGAGVEWPSGSGNFYGGGGGGGLVANIASTAAGGSGVGGEGRNGTVNGGNAVAGTGSGGGGTGNPTTTRIAGSGSGGVVKIRYNPTAWTP